MGNVRNNLARIRKPDRGIAVTPLVARGSTPDRGVERLRSELSGVLSGEVVGNQSLYGTLIQKCIAAKSLEDGIRLHDHIASSSFSGDTFLGNLLVKMYASCGCMQRARSVFESIRILNIYSWNIMLGAYAQNGDVLEAMATFRNIPRKNVISWSTMLTAYTHNSQPRNAIRLFREMDLEGVAPNRVTFLVLLEACTSTGALRMGREIHAEINEDELKNDEKIATALINMYGKSGRLSEARGLLEKMLDSSSAVARNALISAYALHGHLNEAEELFTTMESPTVASWNILIKGYAREGHITAAMNYFRRMDISGFQPDTITLVSLLNACADIPALAEGKLVHSSIDHDCFHLDESIITALLLMYGRTGMLGTAWRLFEKIPERTVVSWTALIATYAHNGHGDVAQKLFQRMALEDGGMPNQVTFNTILCACSHAGLLHYAHDYFTVMSEFGVKPNADHYGCMLDLLGRVGKLGDAEELARTMPFEPPPESWISLLSACSTHEEVDVADRLTELSFGESSSSPYVLLHNILRRL